MGGERDRRRGGARRSRRPDRARAEGNLALRRRARIRSPISSTSASRRRSCFTSADLACGEELRLGRGAVVRDGLRAAPRPLQRDGRRQTSRHGARPFSSACRRRPARSSAFCRSTFITLSISAEPTLRSAARSRALYVLAIALSDGEPGAAFLRQVDRPRAARIRRRGADRRRRRAAARSFNFPMQALVARHARLSRLHSVRGPALPAARSRASAGSAQRS